MTDGIAGALEWESYGKCRDALEAMEAMERNRMTEETRNGLTYKQLVQAWLDGDVIQYKGCAISDKVTTVWVDGNFSSPPVKVDWKKGLYRIKPAEPDVERCEVYVKGVDQELRYKRTPATTLDTFISIAQADPTFICYEYNDGTFGMDVRQWSSATTPAKWPVAVLFRKSK